MRGLSCSHLGSVAARKALPVFRSRLDRSICCGSSSHLEHLKKMPVKVKARANFKKLMRMREKAIQRADKATVKALDRFGAIIRQDSKRAIGSYAKPKKIQWKTVDGKSIPVITPASKPRSPGQPPRSRTSHEFYSLRNIRYLSDYKNAKVRIGPWNTGGKKYGSKTVPDLHEFGGTITTRVVYAQASVTRQNLRKRRGQLTQVSSRVEIHETGKGKPATFRIPKRPFMRPSFDKHKKKATKIWRDYYRAQR